MNSILTVSQFTMYLSSKIKSDPKLKGVFIKGETANVKYSNTGHLYFSLCDESSTLKAVMFSSAAQRLKFKLEDGMNVLVSGNIDLYSRDGTYQIIASDINNIGIGDSFLALEKLKHELTELGYFNENRKKPIKRFPKSIAVVTSDKGAVIHDIMNVIERRYPVCRILLFATSVQGLDAGENIAAAIKSADESGADTIILARGGGAASDLAVFNTKIVADAIFCSKTPIISAIGHEVDYTIADLVSDFRAPTPSAAAEIAVPDKENLISEINVLSSRLNDSMSDLLSCNCEILNSCSKRLNLSSPSNYLEREGLKLYSEVSKLNSLISETLSSKEKDFYLLLKGLEAMSPMNVLLRGYSIVYKDNKPVTDVEELKTDDIIKALVSNGEITAKILDVNKSGGK